MTGRVGEYDLSPGSFIFSLCSARFDAGRLQTCNNLFVKAICKFHLSFSWRFEPKKEKRNHGNMLCSERPLLQQVSGKYCVDLFLLHDIFVFFIYLVLVCLPHACQPKVLNLLKCLLI